MLLAVDGIVVLVVAICLLAPLVGLLFVAMVIAPWLQAFTSGVPISVFEVVGMKLRRTDVKAVLRAMIMANQAGTLLSAVEVERAYLQGVDLEKVTLAFIQAKKEHRGPTFKGLVDAELENRLNEKLGR